MSFFSSLADTAKSIGGAIAAPYGTAYDLATAAFDEKDDNFGTLAAKVAHGASSLADPFFNQQTWTGAVFGKTMQGLDTAYREGVSEPITTAITMGTHVAYDPSNIGDLFNEQQWGKAYKVAQNRSIGQAAMAGEMARWHMAGNLVGLDPTAAGAQILDPMDERAYKQIHAAAPFTTSVGSGITDFAARWYLDPGVLIGKGAKAIKSAATVRTLTAEDRVGLADKMIDGERKRRGLPQFIHNRLDIKSRTDQYLDWSDGMEASALYYGTPELARSAEGRTVAGLLADANKIEQRTLRHDAKRRILAVAGGDASQIKRLEDEVGEAGSIADALKNMKRGTTLELKTQALVPSAQHNPAFIADLERQLDNLNSDEAISTLVDNHQKRLDLMLSTSDTLRELPGVSTKGKRAVAREMGQGLSRNGELATGHDTVDAIGNKLTALGKRANQWAKDTADAPSAQTAFQKSVNHVPLVAIKTTGFLASPWTKAPGKISDALRQAHFQGVVNLHDWDGASIQLDSMMRIAGVDHGTRLKTLSEVYLAKTEPEKMRLIDRIENHSMLALWAKHGEKVDNPDQLAHKAFFEQLMQKGSVVRTQQLSQLRGRSYAATEMPDEMLATRGRGMQAAQDQAGLAGVDGKWKPRVDMIDDHGTPLALPLMETQLANSVPLFDIDLAKKLITRDASHMSRIARAWQQDAMEIGHLTRLQAAGGKGLEKAIEARRWSADMAVFAGQKAMRAWKFGVLFRLGYPVRVLMDDHMRIWTQLNAMTFYGDNGKQGAKNLWYNQVGRRREAAQFMHEARVQRRELLDQLDGNHADVYNSRLEDIQRTSRQIGSHKRNITVWRKRLEEAETKKSLGLNVDTDIAALRDNIRKAEDVIREKQGAVEYLNEQLGDSPDEIKATIAGIEDRLRQGTRAFKPEKHHLGSDDIVLPGGYTASGAYAGPYGKAWLEGTSSSATFDAQMEGAEDRVRNSVMRGSYRTIQPHEPGHLDAWADVLNHQFAMSKVGRHFLRGKSVEEFQAKVASPEWADLRERLGHYAHDPEDWGHRVQALVRDYLPTDELRQLVLDGKVTPRKLAKMFPDMSMRPAVHGNIAAYNMGDVSSAAQVMGKGLNRVYKFLGEMPTDRLSRQPFFNSLYKMHLTELHTERLAAAKAAGREYTQKDIEKLEQTARRLALHDLKRTLFDISAHSHAAHVMRFISPFFAAHQESLSRWWRIVSDDPSIVRKFGLAFDMPRKVGMVYDSTTGEPVKPGEQISSQHRIMLRVPAAWGGKNTGVDKWIDKHFHNWSVNENSFNLILQGGLMNPGAGPLVTVPVEALAEKYADQPEITRVARVLNPYPPDSPLDPLMPATLQRTMAMVRKEGDPEYARRFSQNAMDAMISFEEAHGRPPTKQEADQIMLRAGRQTNADGFLRILWNAVSPSPARPESKYAAIQNGWYKISTQARAEGQDFEWARDRFVEKYGDIYLPLIYSTSLNAGNVNVSTEAVSQVKRHRALLRGIDPSLTRMVLGAAGEGEYSPEARQWFKDAQMRPGDTATYLSDRNPRQQLTEQVVRQGWSKYSALTGALTALAQENGLASYKDSDYLVKVRKAAIDKLQQENPLWWNDYNDFNPTDYDQMVGDMRKIAADPALNADTERQDVQVLKAYLELRDMVTGELARRKAAGLPYTPDANANKPLLDMYSKTVGALVEKSPDFENYFYNGTIDRDPLLVGG